MNVLMGIGIGIEVRKFDYSSHPCSCSQIGIEVRKFLTKLS